MRRAILSSEGILPSWASLASHHAATPKPYFSRMSSISMAPGTRPPGAPTFVSALPDGVKGYGGDREDPRHGVGPS